jgi:hypothetical protein
MHAIPSIPASFRLGLTAAALVGWAGASTLISGTLLAGHLLTLPVPAADDPVVAQGIATHAAGDWTVLHAVSSECRCSQNVLAHLLETARPEGVHETVLLVGPPGDLEARLQAHGFEFVSLTAAELDSRYGIPAVPLLVIADPDGNVRYTGGYTARKQGPEIQDLELLAGLRSGADVAVLPLFGCPTNAALHDSLNPVGLR